MVYITSWQQFQRDAEILYTRSPRRTRYCVKFRPVEGTLVLKITDDATCLKYKTTSSIFLNRFEALNLSLMEKMQNRRPPPPTKAVLSDTEGGRAGTPDPSVPAAAPQSAAAKKKKSKKKK